jgi:lipopolysaccharide export system protein LptC
MLVFMSMKAILIIIVALLVAWGIWWLVWGEDKKAAITPDDSAAAQSLDQNVDLSSFDSKG